MTIEQPKNPQEKEEKLTDNERLNTYQKIEQNIPGNPENYQDKDIKKEKEAAIKSLMGDAEQRLTQMRMEQLDKLAKFNAVGAVYKEFEQTATGYRCIYFGQLNDVKFKLFPDEKGRYQGYLEKEGQKEILSEEEAKKFVSWIEKNNLYINKEEEEELIKRAGVTSLKDRLFNTFNL